MTVDGKNRRVGVVSLGCPKNLVDTEKMLGRFLKQGYTLTADPEEANILVINTCGFKADAEAESREAILEMADIKANNPGKRLVITGCLAQRHGADLVREIPDIDILTGTSQYDQLIPLIESHDPDGQACVAVELPPRDNGPLQEEHPQWLTTPSHTAYVKIAEGCNNACAFCVIPHLRGRFRSRTLEAIEAEVITLSQQGVVEINLVSQDTTLYGRDLAPRTSLAALLKRLARIPGIAWIRTLYLYPTLITQGLLEVMASEEKILPYLDVPLQHSHSTVLTRMKRVERTEDIQRLLEKMDTYLPGATLRTTFIVGFPGETEESFQHMHHFVAEGRFDHVGVFTYSDEHGTPAYHFPDKIDPQTALERKNALMLLQQGISREKLKTRIGTTMPVLVDGVSEESQWLLQGRTMGQAPEVDGIVYINAGTPQPGTIVPVTMTEAHEYDLVGYTQ